MFTLDPDAKNIMPTRYRQVAISSDVESLEPTWLEQHFLGREAYMRTRFIVARLGEECALVEVDRPESKALFSDITGVRVIAPAASCRYFYEPEIDTAIPSQLALVAVQHPDVPCVIVEGQYGHVSFILNPAPLLLNVFDIVPPFPSKLVDQVERVLAVAEDLPPIVPVPVLVDSRDELAAHVNPLPAEVLVPCRGSGLVFADTKVSYLDERPREVDWILLGCDRSQQIHRWFYGKQANVVDICPTKFLGKHLDPARTLTRCCLMQEGVEARELATYVPWGCSLDEVRTAIIHILSTVDVPWTRT
ncbi:DUF7714 family protein [Sphingobium chungbukense]|uniref:DUF7714 family protein n=1 Tax=Sphingobium chungbukense TaxID=56193 RepID=UPI000699701C|nr:hypothetical protein [Sphingobium chungbukense]